MIGLDLPNYRVREILDGEQKKGNISGGVITREQFEKVRTVVYVIM